MVDRSSVTSTGPSPDVLFFFGEPTRKFRCCHRTTCDIAVRSGGVLLRYSAASGPTSGWAALDRRVVLRRLLAVVHAVVGHHRENAEIFRRRIGKQPLAEVDAGLRVRHVDQ